MKIEFSNSQYIREYGKAPKGGYGYWGFECEGHEFWAYGTLTEAKKQVRKQIKEAAPEGYEGYVFAYILP